MTGKQVVDHLMATATDKGTPGRDHEYGFGVVNPVKALTTTPAPSTTPSDIGRKLPPGLASKQSAARQPIAQGEVTTSSVLSTPILVSVGGLGLAAIAMLVVINIARRRRG